MSFKNCMETKFSVLCSDIRQKQKPKLQIAKDIWIAQPSSLPVFLTFTFIFPPIAAVQHERFLIFYVSDSFS